MITGLASIYPQKVRCPVCGEEVDLSDQQAAAAHMVKDEAHKNRVAKIRTDEFLDTAVNAGVLRRV